MTIEGHHHEPSCPYMRSEPVILPSIFSLTLISTLMYVGFVVKNLDSSPMKKMYYRFINSRHTIFFNLYQQLFSAGILNPKAP